MPDALIVAHGSPSDPAPQEAAMQALAARTAAHLPGWRVRGATLAAPGALEQALDGLDHPRIHPFFMAEGWFTRVLLPRRLAAAGASGAAGAPIGRDGLQRTPAFGHAPGLPALCAAWTRQAAETAGIPPRRATLLLAAHGSRVSRASAEGARATAALLGRLAPFARVETGFIEEEPTLAAAARGLGPAAVCLPFFALRAGHVAEDVPQALAAAGFRGLLMPPVGEHPQVPALIAAALSA
jgi:sirohydrochlorin ferrochelatase